MKKIVLLVLFFAGSAQLQGMEWLKKQGSNFIRNISRPFFQTAQEGTKAELAEWQKQIEEERQKKIREIKTMIDKNEEYFADNYIKSEEEIEKEKREGFVVSTKAKFIGQFTPQNFNDYIKSLGKEPYSKDQIKQAFDLYKDEQLKYSQKATEEVKKEKLEMRGSKNGEQENLQLAEEINQENERREYRKKIKQELSEKIVDIEKIKLETKGAGLGRLNEAEAERFKRTKEEYLGQKGVVILKNGAQSFEIPLMYMNISEFIVLLQKNYQEKKELEETGKIIIRLDELFEDEPFLDSSIELLVLTAPFVHDLMQAKANNDDAEFYKILNIAREKLLEMDLIENVDREDFARLLDFLIVDSRLFNLIDKINKIRSDVMSRMIEIVPGKFEFSSQEDRDIWFSTFKPGKLLYYPAR